MLSADLYEGDLGEARLDEGLDLAHVLLNVRPTAERVGHLIRGDELGRGRKGLRIGKIGVHLPAQAEPPELGVGAFDRLIPVGVVGQGDLTHPGLARTARGVEHLPQLGLRLDGDHEIGLVAGQRAGARS